MRRRVSRLPGAQRLRAVALVAALLAPPAVRPSQAQSQDNAHTYFCHVAQPMVARDDRRIEIHPVTYALKLFTPKPGLEIEFTCRPGPVAVFRNQPGDSLGAYEVANLNAASLMGIAIRVEKRPQGTWSSAPDTSAAARAAGKPHQLFFVDELGVDLDLAALVRRRGTSMEPGANREDLKRFDALVEATVDCILENARRSTPVIRRIRLKVIGWERYRHWSDTYVVKVDTERKRFRY
jgi:hypothetical protein